MRKRYNVGDRLYRVYVSRAETYEGVLEPASVELSTFIIRTIRKRPGLRPGRPSRIAPQVTAYPSEFVKQNHKGVLSFSKYCPRWALEQWLSDDSGIFGCPLQRSKSAAYRVALAELRKSRKRGESWGEPIGREEFNMLAGRLNAGITRSTKK